MPRKIKDKPPTDSLTDIIGITLKFHLTGNQVFEAFFPVTIAKNEVDKPK